MTESEGHVVEYQELRAEIRHYLERRAHAIATVLVTTTAVAGFAPRAQSAFLVPTAALVVAFLWYDETRRIRAVQRLAAYLRMYVEPRIPELLYERRAKYHHIQREIASRFVANGMFPAAYAVLLWLMIEEPKYSSPTLEILAVVGVLAWLGLLGLSVRAIVGAGKREQGRWSDAEAARLTHEPARAGPPQAPAVDPAYPHDEMARPTTVSLVLTLGIALLAISGLARRARNAR